MNLRINSLKASRRVAKPIKKGIAFLKVSEGVYISKKAPSKAPSNDGGKKVLRVEKFSLRVFL